MKTSKQSLIDICDVTFAMSVLNGKWKVSIIWELRKGLRRLSELQRAMPGVSEGTLINQLRDLQHNKLITRIDHRELPLRVTYELTPMGVQSLEFIQIIDAWGAMYRKSSQLQKPRSK